MSFALLCVSFSCSEYMFDEQSHQAECLFILVITYLLFKQIINHALQLMSHLCTCEKFFLVHIEFLVISCVVYIF